jgi:hypothetical protein
MGGIHMRGIHMSRNRLIHVLGVLALLLTSSAATQAADSASLAITANGKTVVELYRNLDGSVRYQLNDELALGMSLGVSPIRLTERADAGASGERWLPVFDLYVGARGADRLLPDQSEREAFGRRWFWTVGSNSNLVAADQFDFRSDFAQHFSLQTKAGFLIPLGRRLLLGGALTLDHVSSASDRPEPGSAHERGTSVGAFLGLEFNY